MIFPGIAVYFSFSTPFLKLSYFFFIAKIIYIHFFKKLCEY